MFARSILLALSALCIITPTLAAPTTEVADVESRAICTRRKRLAGAKLIVDAYNSVAPGVSAEKFLRLPLEDDCKTFINPNGGPPVPVAIDETTTKDFAIATRQVFSTVTGEYTDYRNGTTIIHTNVTLGALHSIALPVTFYADVFLFYNLDSCLMQKIQAFAVIPTVVAGIPIEPPIIDQLLSLSPLTESDRGSLLDPISDLLSLGTRSVTQEEAAAEHLANRAAFDDGEGESGTFEFEFVV